jgi:thiol-disulfide isomerase/thioredoxin
VGQTCPAISIDVVGSDEKFSVQDENAQGRVVVLNFWYTTCGPCLEELPYFYSAANDYGDKISIIAVHIEQPNVDVTGFIANNSGHPEWNDGSMTIGWDTDMNFINLFGIEAFPTTVVIGADGVITDLFIGSLENEELIDAIDKALGE